MAKLTYEQLKKINEKMQNGFCLDVSYFCIWGEKTAIKYMNVGEDENNNYIVSAKIHYIDVSQRWSPDPEYVMELHFEYWKQRKGEKCMSSSSRRKFTLKSGYKKKMFSEIQKETANWSEEKLLDTYYSLENYKFAGEL